ncbi:hypothetical protein FBY35_6533 [Streptomyces sp. SLBN-118]|uniref:hypothetical protein n=1 Tax=Streptomyces sp. SLBN-118 TaxID=2768454 RepID=UPI001150424D|nr:hypothetical protein [Streptomyces sp. SLBN-118]TQK44996.1 hypothetical protein FBY35_6533 [Streptomyces sp. SLBN-118]
MMASSQIAEPVQPAQHRDLWPGIAGLGAGALLIAGYVLWSMTPDVTGTGALRRVVLWYLNEDNQDQSEALALILLAAGLLFLFFLVALSRLAGNRSHLVMVGGTVFTAFLLVGALAGNIFAITVRNTDVFPVLPETSLIAILLLNTAYGAIIASMVGAAVMLFAVWRAAQETHAIPAWLGWAGLVVAVLSLAGPWSAWLTPILLAAWVLAASVVLILNARAAREEGAALNPQPLPPQPER